MKVSKKDVLYSILSVVLTFFVVRFLLHFISSDFAVSVIPGWHTVILPPSIGMTRLTLLILVTSFVVSQIFLLIKWLLLVLGNKLNGKYTWLE